MPSNGFWVLFVFLSVRLYPLVISDDRRDFFELLAYLIYLACFAYFAYLAYLDYGLRLPVDILTYLIFVVFCVKVVANLKKSENQALEWR